ncbi:MAG: hypothetical protein JWM93_1559 [Frankiales bacterium]|nr:hypothetical protein [Frankiales bacterium]
MRFSRHSSPCPSRPPVYDLLVQRALALIGRGGGRAVLGITGEPGAGKSTLAVNLVERLTRAGCVVAHVPMDSFHLSDNALRRLGSLERKGAIDTFDAYGYLALLRRVRAEIDHTVYAPDFERTIEQPIAGSIPVPPDVRLVVTEGNYLLAAMEPWPAIRAECNEVWFAELADDERVRRLVARHVEFGKTPDAAREWVATVDEVNARAIRVARGEADLIVDMAAAPSPVANPEVVPRGSDMTVFRRPSSGVPAGDAIPFAHGGTTHLFFLSSPPGTTDYPERVRTTWQHARSDDLAQWEELPPALQPGTGDDIDADGAWTGSVIERDGVFHLFYTGHRVGAEHPQTICLATSTDLVTFTKSTGNPLSVPTDACEPVDWRDPYVFFNEAEGCYWMLIAARLRSGPLWRRGVIMLATSTDLATWVVEEQPLYEPGSTYCPECPEMWQLGSRWYLVYSRFSEHVGTIYRVADSPRGPFRVPDDEELGGRRWYAAKSAAAPDGNGRNFFGWVHDRTAEGRWCWGGDFAAPRRITADSSGQLLVSLPEEVLATFADPVKLAESTFVMNAVGSAQYLSLGMADTPHTYLASFDLSAGDAAAFGVMIRTDVDLGGWFVTIDRVRGSVHLSRSPHPLDDFWADLVGRGGERRDVDGALVAEARLSLGTGTRTACSLLVDGDVLEVYVDRRVALTHRITASSPAVSELGVFVVDGRLDGSADVRTAAQ